MNRYKQNLRVEGTKVYSYGTHVATIECSKLVVHGYWSMTTSAHINYVAKEYGLTVVKEDEQKEPEVKNESLAMASKVAMMGEIFGGTPKEKNDWKKRMLATQNGISFPEDWDELSEEEKQRRLDGAIKFGLDQK